MRGPPVFATRQSFAGELTAPEGRNRRPPISAGCRRASLLCGLRCAPAEKVPHSCIHAEKENLCCLPVGQGCRLRKRDPACGFAERWRAVRVPVAVGLRCAPAGNVLRRSVFACLFVLCPALQRANRLFSLRPALRLSGGVVSPAEVARGTFPRRTGKGAGSVGLALLNVPGRSRCSSSPGSFGWSSVPCSLPQRNWRALRGLRALRLRRTQGHQKGRKDWLSGPV